MKSDGRRATPRLVGPRSASERRGGVGRRLRPGRPRPSAAVAQRRGAGGRGSRAALVSAARAPCCRSGAVGRSVRRPRRCHGAASTSPSGVRATSAPATRPCGDGGAPGAGAGRAPVRDSSGRAPAHAGAPMGDHDADPVPVRTARAARPRGGLARRTDRRRGGRAGRGCRRPACLHVAGRGGRGRGGPGDRRRGRHLADRGPHRRSSGRPMRLRHAVASRAVGAPGRPALLRRARSSGSRSTEARARRRPGASPRIGVLHDRSRQTFTAVLGGLGRRVRAPGRGRQGAPRRARGPGSWRRWRRDGSAVHRVQWVERVVAADVVPSLAGSTPARRHRRADAWRTARACTRRVPRTRRWSSPRPTASLRHEVLVAVTVHAGRAAACREGRAGAGRRGRARSCCARWRRCVGG